MEEDQKPGRRAEGGEAMGEIQEQWQCLPQTGKSKDHLQEGRQSHRGPGVRAGLLSSPPDPEA